MGEEIKKSLHRIRHHQGWTIDDLARFLEINSMTVRNSMWSCNWSDLVVTILKLKKTISEDLACDYQKALERERIERRKKQNKEKL